MRDALIQICQHLADCRVAIGDWSANTEALRRTVADFNNALHELGWPCVRLLHDRWRDLGVRFGKIDRMPADAQQALITDFANAISEAYVALEATRLCLRAHPELPFAELPPIDDHALTRLSDRPHTDHGESPT